jgi:hypothetical protein
MFLRTLPATPQHAHLRALSVIFEAAKAARRAGPCKKFTDAARLGFLCDPKTCNHRGIWGKYLHFNTLLSCFSTAMGAVWNGIKAFVGRLSGTSEPEKPKEMEVARQTGPNQPSGIDRFNEIMTATNPRYVGSQIGRSLRGNPPLAGQEFQNWLSYVSRNPQMCLEFCRQIEATPDGRALAKKTVTDRKYFPDIDFSGERRDLGNLGSMCSTLDKVDANLKIPPPISVFKIYGQNARANG